MDVEHFIRRYLTAIERDEVVGREAEWYTDDAVQVEWPNLLLPQGATRRLADIRAAGERGRAIVERQRYDVSTVVAQSDKVAVEAVFRATFKVDLPGWPKGETMEARFAMFFLLKDGKIRRHQTYDCFIPPDGQRG